MKKRFVFLAVSLAACLVLCAGSVLKAHGTGHQESTTLACNAESFYCPVGSADELEHTLADFPVPETIAPPLPAPTPVLSVNRAVSRTVTYDVTTRGTITANLDEFKSQANQTLNDSRGWRRLGVEFKEVASGGSFTLVLSEASQLPTFWQGCSVDYSCQVGSYVIINQDRWLGASAAWNNSGGSLRDYRHMVINHETGHWLGHGHETCPGPGQAAAVMQQQSIDLGGCNFNPWPLENELWSSRLGI